MACPRILAVAVLFALTAAIAFAIFAGGGGPEDPGIPGAAGGSGSGQPSSRQAPVAVGEVADAARAGAEADEGARVEVDAETALSGTFRSPAGSWPGGGRAELFPFSEPPEGGMLGLFSAGMELARQGERGGRDSRGEEIKQRFEAWLGRADMVAAADVDPLGRFEIRNPPAGRWSVSLQHPSLRVATPVDVTIAEGEHRDLGDVGTEVAAGLLVVVSDEDGRPVPGARVQLSREMDPSRFMDPTALQDIGGLIRALLPVEGRTDDNGRCALTGLDHDAAWSLLVGCTGFVDAFREVRVFEGRETIQRVELLSGARITVSVQGPDGGAFEGARVLVRYPDILRPILGSVQASASGGGGQTQPMTFRLRTDTEGIARKAGLPVGRAEVRLVTPGYRRATHELTIPVSGEVEDAFVLEVGASVSGVVLDEHGQPIEGANVLYMAALGQTVMGLQLESIVGLELLTIGADERGVLTDAAGRFVLGGLEPDGGDVHLAAVAPDHDPARVDTVVGDRDVEFRLLRACNVRGRVVADDTGEPIHAFRVALKQRAFLVIDRPVVQRDVEASADGSFDVSPVPRQGFRLVIEAEGYAASSTSVDLGAGSVDCGEIRLKLPAAVEGVTIGPDGTPVAGVRIRTSKGGPADSMILAQLLGERRVESDEHGRFRVGGLTGRAVRLLADLEGYAPLRSKAIRIAPGETVEGLVLELTRGGSIRGLVLDGEHRPLVGWNIQAEHATGSSHAFARSDDEGRFLIEGLAGGTYRVVGMPPDFGRHSRWNPTDPSEFGDFDLSKIISEAVRMTVEDRVVVRDGEEVEITLVHEDLDSEDSGVAVTVEGEVRVGGAPLDEGLVTLMLSGTTMQRHLADVSEGRFRIDGVVPGTYRLQVRAGLLSGDLGQARVVVVPAGATHTLTLDFPGGALAGRVVDGETGEPVVGVLLSLSRPSTAAPAEKMDLGEGTVLTDGSGEFRFDGLEEGVYDVFARQWMLGAGGGRSGRLHGVVVGPGDRREGLEVALARGGALRVTVVVRGTPCANALVTLLGPHGDALDLFHRTLTDRDGVAEFTGLPDGVYRASVDAPRSAPTVSEVAEVRGGGEAALEVVVRRGVPVTLKLVGEIPDAWRGESLMYAVWRPDGSLLRNGRARVPPPGAAEEEARRGLSVGSYEPGKYRLRVEGVRLGVLDEERTVPASDAVEWTIDVDSLRRR